MSGKKKTNTWYKDGTTWKVNYDKYINGVRTNHEKSGFKTAAEAKTYFNQLVKKYEEIEDSMNVNITMTELIDQYLTSISKDLTPRTFNYKKRIIERYIIPERLPIKIKGTRIKSNITVYERRQQKTISLDFFEEKEVVRKIDRNKFEQWTNFILGIDDEYLSLDSKRRVIRVFRELMEYAYVNHRAFPIDNLDEWLSLKSLDYSKIVKPNSNLKANRGRVWNPSEFALFMENIDDEIDRLDTKSPNYKENLRIEKMYKVLFLTMWSGFLRLGELIGLKVKDLQDDKGPMINIERQVVYNPKLFDTSGIIDDSGIKAHETKLKNNYSYRTNPISKRLNTMIVEYLKLYYEEDDFQIIKNLYDEDYIFSISGKESNRPISRNAILSKLHKHTNDPKSKTKDPNKPIYISPKQIRTSTATAYALDENKTMSVARLNKLRKRMGHASLTTTYDFYVAVSGNVDKEDREELEEAFDILLGK